jgi:hypothetical protein
VNFQNSLDVHLKDAEKKKKLALLEEKAKAYQRNIKLNNIKTQSNITKIQKKEALALQKQLQTISIEQLKILYEDIPKAQR